MALTKKQQAMISYLKAYEATEDEALGIMLMLKDSEEKLDKMKDWMKNHTAADMGEVTEAAHKIYLEQ